MSKSEAINSGAEMHVYRKKKYPDIVTVYSIGNVSKRNYVVDHMLKTQAN